MAGLGLHDPRDEIDAADTRQVHVQDHDHDLLAAEDFERFLPRGRRDDLVPLFD